MSPLIDFHLISEPWVYHSDKGEEQRKGAQLPPLSDAESTSGPSTRPRTAPSTRPTQKADVVPTPLEVSGSTPQLFPPPVGAPTVTISPPEEGPPVSPKQVVAKTDYPDDDDERSDS